MVSRRGTYAKAVGRMRAGIPRRPLVTDGQKIASTEQAARLRQVTHTGAEPIPGPGPGSGPLLARFHFTH
jgi:hypothetical protein